MKYLPIIFMALMLITVIICYVKFSNGDDGFVTSRGDGRRLGGSFELKKSQLSHSSKAGKNDRTADVWSTDFFRKSKPITPRDDSYESDEVVASSIPDDFDIAAIIEEVSKPNSGSVSILVGASEAEIEAKDEEVEDLEETILKSAVFKGIGEKLAHDDMTVILKNAVIPEKRVENPTPVVEVEATLEEPMAFGYKMCWLAIPTNNLSNVLTALNLQEINHSSWSNGLTTACGDRNKVFVSPVIDGHVLVIGRALWKKLDLDADIRENTWFSNLSSSLGEVKYFTTMSELDNHGWAYAKNGKIIRAYGYSGEISDVVWNVGKISPEEKELGYNFMGYNRSAYKKPTERDVVELAMFWAVDTTFKWKEYQPSKGLVGKIIY